MANKPPAALKTLAPGRLLAVTELDDSSWALATTEIIGVADRSEEADWRITWQRPWHEVAGAEWDETTHTFDISWVENSPAARLRTLDDAPKSFPRVFRERVDASIVYIEFERIPAGGRLRGAIRRNANGDLFAQITATHDVRRTPELERQVDELERRLWEIVGT